MVGLLMELFTCFDSLCLQIWMASMDWNGSFQKMMGILHCQFDLFFRYNRVLEFYWLDSWGNIRISSYSSIHVPFTRHSTIGSSSSLARMKMVWVDFGICSCPRTHPLARSRILLLQNLQIDGFLSFFLSLPDRENKDSLQNSFVRKRLKASRFSHVK